LNPSVNSKKGKPKREEEGPRRVTMFQLKKRSDTEDANGREGNVERGKVSRRKRGSAPARKRKG